jgi:shikimate kinase
VRRVAVIGVTGAGKSTLGRALAERGVGPHVELDALHWEPNWVEAETEVFRARVAVALAGERWVADGNYSKVRDLVWGRADTVVWLDYAFAVTYSRLLWRTARRVVSRETLWNGNQERVGTQLFSRDSLLLWGLTTYGRYRRTFPVLLASPAYQHVQAVRLRTPRATARWLASVVPEPLVDLVD